MAISALVAGVLLLFNADYGGVGPIKTKDNLPYRDTSTCGEQLPGGIAPAGVFCTVDEKLPQSNAVSALWVAAATGGIAVIVGAALLALGSTRWVRLVGTGTLALGLTSNGYLIKEVKFGDLFKLDTHIDKVALELEFEAKLKQLSEFGPERLVAVENFESGRAEIRPEMDEPIAQVCQRWKDHGGESQHGMLLITGSADRVPLAASIRSQYESNVGLARARAEQVRSRVLKCGVPAAQIITLVSGPRNTPAVERNRQPAGFAEDRSVVVWALWSIPVSRN